MTKYEQIINDIKNKITRREYTENQVLPSEKEMCEYYSVSRITVRKAVNDLVNEGILYRVGRKGCFVKESANTKLSHVYSFTDAILNQGKIPTKRQLSFSKEKAGVTYAKLLGITEDESVYVIKSLYFANNQPYCINTSVLPESLFPKLEYFNFNDRSLYDVLKHFYHLHIVRKTQYITAIKGTEDIDTLLEIKNSNVPLLRVKATTFCIIDGVEKAFEYYDAYLTDILYYYVE
ncbi:GntR family transcriptional regulator [Lonepinella koalarum]|uniref:GntR family transcriptional regulator n=1 Tax=Lonepinella koalarum TaxID=53417 RepID=A0A4R1L0J5_9PAST|nr:GntR family transcriptional regulator [Lonepinella koalarum]MDH2926163.1 hypothetical protein [Lonepinella koalarum]TCK71314.1 GntR family transcriptional regulator [Lonepinella koalarum]